MAHKSLDHGQGLSSLRLFSYLSVFLAELPVILLDGEEN